MLQLAAAALVIDRAGRRDAVSARLNKLQQLGVAVLLLRLQHLGADLLTRKRPLHKKGIAFRAAYPFAFMCQSDNVQHDFVILAHRQSGDLRRNGTAAGVPAAAVLLHVVRFTSFLYVNALVRIAIIRNPRTSSVLFYRSECLQ
ncbi:hypothetical protein D3C81_253670 [compost metagenome]